MLLFLSGSSACTDDYEFLPYEPEKAAPAETLLFRCDFLSDGETALKEFDNLENHGSWSIEERGLYFDGASESAIYLGLNRRITFEERVTRVRVSLFSDTRFGLHWLERDGKGGSLFTVDAAAGTLNIHKFGAEDKIETSIPFPVENGHVYMLEAVKSFRSNTFTITDTETGASASVATASELDSSSGGNSVEQNEFKGGRQNNLFGMRHLSVRQTGGNCRFGGARTADVPHRELHHRRRPRPRNGPIRSDHGLLAQREGRILGTERFDHRRRAGPDRQ